MRLRCWSMERLSQLSLIYLRVFFSFTSYLDVFCSKENETDFKPYKIRREGSFVSGFK